MTEEAPQSPDRGVRPALVSGRGLVAVLAGILTMVLVGMVATWLALLMTDSGSPRMAVNLGSNFLAAVLGGYVAGTVGRTRPLLDATGVALVVVMFGALAALNGSLQPEDPFFIGTSAIGAMVGGVLRRLRGIPPSAEERLQEAFDAAVRDATAQPAESPGTLPKTDQS